MVFWLFKLASPARFERAAFRLGGECSILLSYGDNDTIFLRALSERGNRRFLCNLKRLVGDPSMCCKGQYVIFPSSVKIMIHYVIINFLKDQVLG
jgi:hypothetical protein